MQTSPYLCWSSNVKFLCSSLHQSTFSTKATSQHGNYFFNQSPIIPSFPQLLLAPYHQQMQCRGYTDDNTTASSFQIFKIICSFTEDMQVWFSGSPLRLQHGIFMVNITLFISHNSLWWQYPMSPPRPAAGLHHYLRQRSGVNTRGPFY